MAHPRKSTRNISITLTTDGANVTELRPEVEFIVETKQLHKSIFGPDGWEYVAILIKSEKINTNMLTVNDCQQ